MICKTIALNDLSDELNFFMISTIFDEILNNNLDSLDKLKQIIETKVIIPTFIQYINDVSIKTNFENFKMLFNVFKHIDFLCIDEENFKIPSSFNITDFCLLLLISFNTGTAEIFLSRLSSENYDLTTKNLSTYKFNFFEEYQDFTLLTWAIKHDSNQLFEFCLTNFPSLVFTPLLYSRDVQNSDETVSIKEFMTPLEFAIAQDHIYYVERLIQHVANNCFSSDSDLSTTSQLSTRLSKQNLTQLKMFQTQFPLLFSPILRKSPFNMVYDKMLTFDLGYKILKYLIDVPWVTNNHTDKLLKKCLKWSLETVIDRCSDFYIFDFINYSINENNYQLNKKNIYMINQSLDSFFKDTSVYHHFNQDINEKNNELTSRLIMSILENLPNENHLLSLNKIIDLSVEHNRTDIFTILIMVMQSILDGTDNTNINPDYMFVYLTKNMKKISKTKNHIIKAMNVHGTQTTFSTEATDPIVNDMIKYHDSLIKTFKRYKEVLDVNNQWHSFSTNLTLQNRLIQLNLAAKDINHAHKIKQNITTWKKLSSYISQKDKLTLLVKLRAHCLTNKFITKKQLTSKRLTRLQSLMRKKHVQKTYNKQTIRLLNILKQKNAIIVTQTTKIDTLTNDKNKLSSTNEQQCLQIQSLSANNKHLLTNSQSQEHNIDQLNALLVKHQAETLTLSKDLKSLKDNYSFSLKKLETSNITIHQHNQSIEQYEDKFKKLKRSLKQEQENTRKLSSQVQSLQGNQKKLQIDLKHAKSLISKLEKSLKLSQETNKCSINKLSMLTEDSHAMNTRHSSKISRLLVEISSLEKRISTLNQSLRTKDYSIEQLKTYLPPKTLQDKLITTKDRFKQTHSFEGQILDERISSGVISVPHGHVLHTYPDGSKWQEILINGYIDQSTPQYMHFSSFKKQSKQPHS